MYEKTLGINAKGHLTIGDCDAVELAQTYGTPLYVMEERTIRQALRDYRQSLAELYPQGGAVAYASKACCFKAMFRLLQEEDCAADVVSGGELYTALAAGFPAQRLYFHGNNKTHAELRMALEAGVGRIVVDNEEELEALAEIARDMGKTATIYLRITPGVEAHTHEFIRTGQIDSKFGFTLETGEALRAAARAVKADGIALVGVHCHIGSQIFDEAPFIQAADVMLRFMAQVRDETGHTMTELDLGGGFGIPYTAEDHPLPVGEYMRLVADSAKDRAKELDFPFPFIVIEPGRSVVACAGITLYTIGGIKEIPGVRSYVRIDGGMTDNPRYALYQAPYTVLIADRASEPKAMTATIAGRCCESGDLIQEHTALQRCAAGDTLAVLGTGAYNYAMSSNYNRLPRPAVVMVDGGTSRVVVKGETYEDIVRNDV